MPGLLAEGPRLVVSSSAGTSSVIINSSFNSAVTGDGGVSSGTGINEVADGLDGGDEVDNFAVCWLLSLVPFAS